MRTQEEIEERFRARVKGDPFGFESMEYLRAMPKESVLRLQAEGLLNQKADLSDWAPTMPDDASIRAVCADYMDFAWDKANNCRGISAARSLGHYKAWLWMLGEDQFEDIEEYEFYGKDQLVRICAFLGLDSSQWDDGVRVNSESEL